MSSLEERFKNSFVKREPHECWEWTAGRTGGFGYGALSVNGKMKGAHRISYEIHKGPIPKGLMILHSCDNPVCVNPHHLRVGTQRENMNDKRERGRETILYGEQRPNAKLTRNQVEEIRSSVGIKQQVLADKYGVTNQYISKILAGQRWQHLLDIKP